jgi:hypothetical protein
MERGISMKTYSYNNGEQIFNTSPSSVLLSDGTRQYFPSDYTDEMYEADGFTISTIPDVIFTPPEKPPKTQEELEDELWYNCNKYQMRRISGASLCILTIGVLQGLPKSLAIKAWIKDLWTGPNGYYERKALVSITNPVSLDFSDKGEMPYSIPELNAEVGL